ncbi:MAG: DUF4258 domain-containing protein [Anaerolineae bacterium]|nr:DUF4258 domain-containing protein [Anaerolineae bacterium]MDW8068977.1 DUF4258 domain-containing protein [Anaerolineae bacterium]
MAIRYTRHAEYKFAVLREHGFPITPAQVADTLRHPDRVIPQSGGRLIAQKRLTEEHVLRVIYRVEGDDAVVITFYPGRRDRYEDEV